MAICAGEADRGGGNVLLARMVLLRLAEPKFWMTPFMLPKKVLLVTVNTP